MLTLMEVRCSTRPICSAMPMNLRGAAVGYMAGEYVWGDEAHGKERKHSIRELMHRT
jgi:hypothetical protein